MKNQSFGYRVFTVCNSAFMILLMLCMIYPLYYCVVASISDPVELARNPQAIFWPVGEWTLSAYDKVLHHSQILSGFFNTIFVLVVGTVINLVLTVTCAYTLSLKNLMLKTPLALMIVFTMYFSGGLIPGYLNVKSFGMIDSLWALIIPSALSTYNMIIMKTAFEGIPDSLLESARLDGAGNMTILLKIMLPLSGPTLAVMVLYYAVAHWNSWFSASIYLNDPTKFPLQLVMRNILDSASVTEMMGDIGAGEQADYVQLIKYALVVITTAPILLLYPFLQKYFVKGVMIGAVKG